MLQRNRLQLNLACDVISSLKSETSGYPDLLPIPTAATDDRVLLDEADEEVVEQDGDGREGNDGWNLKNVEVKLPLKLLTWSKTRN